MKPSNGLVLFTGLWGIINNAGLSTFGEVEWCNVDVYQRTAEVNIFGSIRVTKAFLPLVRKARGMHFLLYLTAQYI